MKLQINFIAATIFMGASLNANAALVNTFYGFAPTTTVTAIDSTRDGSPVEDQNTKSLSIVSFDNSLGNLESVTLNVGTAALGGSGGWGRSTIEQTASATSATRVAGVSASTSGTLEMFLSIDGGDLVSLWSHEVVNGPNCQEPNSPYSCEVIIQESSTFGESVDLINFFSDLDVFITASSIELIAIQTASADLTGCNWQSDCITGSSITMDYTAQLNYVYDDLSAVPVPAAVWLFGSGLIGLLGFARRKKA